MSHKIHWILFLLLFCFGICNVSTGQDKYLESFNEQLKKIVKEDDVNDGSINFKLKLKEERKNDFDLADEKNSNPKIKLRLNEKFEKGKNFNSKSKFEIDVISRNIYKPETKKFNSLNKYLSAGTLLKDYKPWDSKKRFWVAAGEIALLEFIPFAFSAYIKDWSGSTEINWTKISFKSVWSNLSNGWFYDGDNFLTNLFAHPYHGNLFFNAGRTNGYDFWESTGFAFAGSAIWEHFWETWPAAFNDWVMTGFNGISLGEMTYRLATLVTDNKATGSERMWLEIAGGIINPVRAFNRLISGESHRVFNNPSWRTPDKLELTLNAGARMLDKTGGENFAKEGVQEGLFEMQFAYGDYLKSDFKTPFSNFRLNMSVSTGEPHLTQLQSTGNLFGFHVKKEKTFSQLFVTSLNYNYFNNPGFVFGSASIGNHFYTIYKLSEKYNLITDIGLQLIPMGATPNDYFAGPEGRNYDFGPGIGGSLGASLKSGRWNIATLIYTSGWIWTQSDPADSKHHLHYLNLELQYPMKEYFSIGLAAGSYWRNSYYLNDPDVKFSTPVVRIFFKTVIL